MSSINTNASAMTALQSLAATNKNLETTQGRISTGLRVAEASDNAAYWSIATTMRSDNKANSSVQDALGLGAGKIDTAYTAMNKAIEVVDEIKQKLKQGHSSEKVTRNIPVYVAYFTAWPDMSGKVEYFSDVYGRDDRVRQAIEATEAVRAPST